MEPYVETYRNPGNNTILQTHTDNGVECADCHNGPGIIGTAKSRIAGLTMIISELTDDYDIDNLRAEVPNEQCSKSGCHDSVDWKIETIKGFDYHPYTNNGTKSPITGSSCTTCHNPRIGGTGLSKASCIICHDITEEELQSHESRTCGKTTCHGRTDESGHQPRRPKEDACINCHNRKHPSDARVPFSIVDNYTREGVKIDLVVNNEFCSDCHKQEYTDFTSQSAGVCRDCHTVHKEVSAPHNLQPDLVVECSDCHQSIQNHNTFDISFKNLHGSLENSFCSSCHKDQFDAYVSEPSNTGYCTDCHVNHEISDAAHLLPTDAYNECGSCHIEMEDKHNLEVVNYQDFPSTDVQNELCSSCHYSEYTVYNTYNVGKCTTCHETHSKPSTFHFTTDPYNACTSCHVEIPDKHDPTKIIFKTDEIWIENDFCKTCHNTQFVSLTDTSSPDKKHTSRQCVTCHGEHEKIQVDFGKCIGCHKSEDIPASHNKSTTGCTNCHDVERYIHDLQNR